MFLKELEQNEEFFLEAGFTIIPVLLYLSTAYHNEYVYADTTKQVDYSVINRTTKDMMIYDVPLSDEVLAYKLFPRLVFRKRR